MLSWCRTYSCSFVGLVLACLVGHQGMAQDAPSSTIRQPELRRDALTNLTIIPRPGERIENGTILMKDGVIVAVGEDLEVPAGYRIYDQSGFVAYPGLVEPALVVDTGDESEAASQQRGAYHNSKIIPQVDVADMSSAAGGDAQALRKMGFCSAMVLPENGIIQGRGCLILLGEESGAQRTLGGARPLAMTTRSSGGWGSYPGSSMGVHALTRQALIDAHWQADSREVFEVHPDGNEPPFEGRALESMRDVLDGSQPVIIDASTEIRALRGARLAEEFNLDAIILGGGTEFRRVDEIAATNRPMIVPLVFPDKPKVEGLRSTEDITLRTLLTWKHAPENPARLMAAGVPVSLTTHRLKSRGDFRKNIAKAIEHGLDRDEALAAVTINPARLMRAEDRLGTIEEGRIANVVIVEGDLFEPSDSIREVWVAGRRQEFKSDPKFDFPETGTLVMGELNRSVEVDRGKKSFSVSTIDVVQEEGAPALEEPANPDDPAEEPVEEVRAEKQEDEPKKQSWRARNVSFTDGGLSGIINGEALDLEGPLRFDLMLVDERLSGIARTRTGETVRFMVEATTEEVTDETEQEEEAEKETTEETPVELAELPVPLGAYGRMNQPDQQTVLFTNGRIWTASDAGILEEHDVLIRDGVIEAIGTDLQAPEDAVIVDLNGRHLTPGMIDCHSHTGIDGGVNEGGQNNTAEVRIGDVLDPDDINWYRQLAGGLTAANQLHGSANPIGGQNAVVKLRWGAPVDEIHIAGAKPGIKFALGENVVRPSGRYPDTRMGVAAFFEDAFRAASEYRAKHQRYQLLSEEERIRIMPPRRDLELETLVEILEGDRLIHCHSYRQDEILMLLRTAERWGFTIGTLQHILEGYKVADVIAEHGAGASSFSDWWAYKMEVMDAIPHNGAIMAEAGVLVSFNSDSDELARRMNTEAAKAVRYGGIEPHEALKFVTINPARQLRIDDRTGSIEVGKDADLVVWSGDPLSTMTRCEQTWVDGRRFFDAEEDRQMIQQIKETRSEMLASLVEQAPRKTSTEMKPASKDDPVSGTWVCSLEVPRMGGVEITLELAMAPDGAVTGTAGMAMMDVEMAAEGTFDKGSSKLELELTMEGNSVSSMELMISGDTLEGSGESAMRPGTSTAITGKRMGSPSGGDSDRVVHRRRGSLIVRMLDQGDDQVIDMIRNGMDPAEIRAGQCCYGLEVIQNSISEEAGR